MTALFAWFQAQLSNNQIFTGVAGASAIAGVLYWLREIPSRLWKRVKWACTYSVTFTNDGDSYGLISDWLGERMMAWHVRELKAMDRKDSDRRDHDLVALVDETVSWNLTVGFGTFWFFWKGRPFIIERSGDIDGKAMGTRIRETLKITSIGFRRKTLDALLSEAQKSIAGDDRVKVFLFAEYWRLIDTRDPRPRESVILPEGVLEEIARDIAWFSSGETRRRYTSLGIPYRRGLLFHGVPGTGKSTTAFFLAGHFGMPIYCLNMASIRNDSQLFDAVAQVPTRAILLIEDIDAIKAAASGKRAATPRGQPTPQPQKGSDEDEDPPVSLSGLLNCIDGVIAKEGRILIMTSNHPDSLDEALVRPGRIDRRVEFPLASAKQAAAIYARFFGEALAGEILERYSGGMSPAEIQGVCQRHDAQPEMAAAALTKRTVH